jgi:hypothetical protein
MAQKNSVGLKNEEDIFERILGDKGCFPAGWGFKPTIAMAPSHEDWRQQGTKSKKFVVNEILQYLLKWLCGCSTCVRSDTPPCPIPFLIG